MLVKNLNTLKYSKNTQMFGKDTFDLTQVPLLSLVSAEFRSVKYDGLEKLKCAGLQILASDWPGSKYEEENFYTFLQSKQKRNEQVKKKSIEWLTTSVQKLTTATVALGIYNLPK